MSTVFIVVEGFTEQTFVKSVLAPHLAARNLWVTPIEVTTKRDRDGRKSRGGGDWTKWRDDIARLCRDGRESIRITTLFDLYGLPANFPCLHEHSQIADTEIRAQKLEEAMADAIHDRRFIPYLQRHELEALVLAALTHLEPLLVDRRDIEGLKRLVRDIGDLAPEDVNDGEQTAPSKRLESFIPSYNPPGHAKGEGKSLYGPLALEAAGLATIRSRCPRFDAWVTKLEALGGTTPS